MYVKYSRFSKCTDMTIKQAESDFQIFFKFFLFFFLEIVANIMKIKECLNHSEFFSSMF